MIERDLFISISEKPLSAGWNSVTCRSRKFVLCTFLRKKMYCMSPTVIVNPSSSASFLDPLQSPIQIDFRGIEPLLNQTCVATSSPSKTEITTLCAKDLHQCHWLYNTTPALKKIYTYGAQPFKLFIHLYMIFYLIYKVNRSSIFVLFSLFSAKNPYKLAFTIQVQVLFSF